MKSLSVHITEALLTEGFVIVDDVVYFDPNDKSNIRTKFGKYKKMVPIEGKLTFGRFYAAYSKSKDFDQDEYNEVLLAIKGQSQNLAMDHSSYVKFIDRTAIYLSKIITSNSIDTILLMSTTSPLVSDLVNSINKRLPKYYEIKTFSKAIFKTPENIRLDFQGIELGASLEKALRKVVDRAHNDGYFKIKEVPDVRSRKFFKDWLAINNNFLSHIVDKNVCVIDDFITSGESMKQASELLEDAGANNVIGLAILKG
jgi:hypothetical protein